MKTESFILLFCLLSICFTQDSENQCETQFLSILKTKCLGLGSCTLNTEDMKCLPISSCSGKSETDCPNTIPSDYHKKNVNMIEVLVLVMKLIKYVQIIIKRVMEMRFPEMNVQA